MSSEPAYIYLHGFASGPSSTKARYLQQRFAEQGKQLVVPDLNQRDFFHLTLTRQIQQVASLFPAFPNPVVLIGSSFGGLTAAWLGERYTQVQHLILLAPAFEFLAVWLPQLGSRLKQWQTDGTLEIYHYAAAQPLPLSYEFVRDLQLYPDGQLQRVLNTLILHGEQDEVIPVQASQTFAIQRPWVRLETLQSNHSLGNVLPEVWEAIWREITPRARPPSDSRG